MGYIYLFLGIIGMLYSLISLRVKKNDLKKNLFLTLLCTFVLLIGVYEIGFSHKTDEEKENAEFVSDSNNDTNNQDVNYSLGITPDQFLKSFNTLTTQQDLQDFYYLDGLDIKEGEANVDTFQTELTPRVGISGTVNKADGTLAHVQLILVPDNTSQDNVDLNNLVLMLTSAVDPKITEEGIQYVSNKAIQNLNSNEKGITIYENGFSYITMRSGSNQIFRVTKF